jgi:hypothetical protein
MALLGILEELYSRFKKWNVTIDKIVKAIDYLDNFGYFSGEKSLTDLTLSDVIDAVMAFQEIFELKVDGEIGPKTLKAMEWPRCGCPDEFILEAKEQIRAWGTHKLTYCIKNRDRDLSANAWDDAIARALASWTAVCDLQFTRVNLVNSANFIFDIGSGRGSNFDGPGGTLAWAQLPPNGRYKGQLLCKHDAGETWTTSRNKRGILLENVTCHEVGHLLGLTHSRSRGALMAPYYSPNVRNPQANDDISRIQRLYGKPKGGTNPPPKPPSPGNGGEEGESLTLKLEITGRIKDVHIPGYRVSKMG